jgi:hypothetical protein
MKLNGYMVAGLILIVLGLFTPILSQTIDSTKPLFYYETYYPMGGKTYNSLSEAWCYLRDPETGIKQCEFSIWQYAQPSYRWLMRNVGTWNEQFDPGDGIIHVRTWEKWYINFSEPVRGGSSGPGPLPAGNWTFWFYFYNNVGLYNEPVGYVDAEKGVTYPRINSKLTIDPTAVIEQTGSLHVAGVFNSQTVPFETWLQSTEPDTPQEHVDVNNAAMGQTWSNLKTGIYEVYGLYNGTTKQETATVVADMTVDVVLDFGVPVQTPITIPSIDQLRETTKQYGLPIGIMLITAGSVLFAVGVTKKGKNAEV